MNKTGKVIKIETADDKLNSGDLDKTLTDEGILTSR
jgi:hypothetical protein